MAEEEMTLQERIDDQFERDENDLQRDRSYLKSWREEVPRILEHLEEMTGISQSELLRCAVQAGFSNADIKWYRFLSYMRTFYVHKERGNK